MSSIIITLLEIGLALVVVSIFGKYITYAIQLITMFIPSVILQFVLFAIAITILLFVIHRKD